MFETAILSPGGIAGNDFPQFLALNLEGKIDSRTITEISVNLGGQVVARVIQSAELAPFNGFASVDGQSVGPGGIVNMTLNAAARGNLKNSIGTAPQYIRCQISYKFTGTSLLRTSPTMRRTTSTSA